MPLLFLWACGLKPPFVCVSVRVCVRARARVLVPSFFVLSCFHLHSIQNADFLISFMLSSAFSTLRRACPSFRRLRHGHDGGAWLAVEARVVDHVGDQARDGCGVQQPTLRPRLLGAAAQQVDPNAQRVGIARLGAHCKVAVAIDRRGRTGAVRRHQPGELLVRFRPPDRSTRFHGKSRTLAACWPATGHLRQPLNAVEQAARRPGRRGRGDDAGGDIHGTRVCLEWSQPSTQGAARLPSHAAQPLHTPPGRECRRQHAFSPACHTYTIIEKKYNRNF